MDGQAKYTADEALEILLEGNRRFMSCELNHKDHCHEARELLVERQQPLAVVLTCADSRVPPVDIFDQGLGDLFILRAAGNLLNDHMLGSIEYAVSHLHAPLVMVMGHSNCGAVTAVASGVRLGGHIATLTPPIESAIKSAKEMKDKMEGKLVDNASKMLAKKLAKNIAECEPIVSDLVQEGKVKVVASFYDLHNGGVTILD